MASIKINEIDNTVVNPLVDGNDNIVFVPGNSITGPIGVPTLCKSYEEFIQTFGDHSPEADDDQVGTSWEYAANLLQTGEFYVLFDRIAPDVQKTIVTPATAASTNIIMTVDESPVIIGSITAKSAGAAGNNIAYQFTVEYDSDNINSVIFSVKNGDEEATTTVIINESMTVEAAKASIVDFFQNTYTSDLISVVTSTSDFLPDNMSALVNLTGGTDESSTTITTSSAVKAEAYIVVNVEGVGNLNVGKVTELYGGTFGNSLAFEVYAYGNIDTLTNKYISGEIRFRTYKVSDSNIDVQIDDFQLINIAGLTTNEVNAKLITMIGNGYKTKYFEITVTDATNFKLTSGVSRTRLSGGEDPTDTVVIPAVPETFSSISDTLIYDAKFITSANYYNTRINDVFIDVVSPMKDIAESRKDCTAFANIPIALDKGEVQNFVQQSAISSYVTFHAPWAYVSLQTGGTKWMAPSFIALVTLAKSVKMGYQIWQAPAGVNRASAGMVQKTEYEIGSATLDQWQNDKAPYINPIMYLLKYGYVIFGQRTSYMVSGSAYDKSALQELTVRLLINEIKKKIKTVCLGLSFEANNIRTWNSFRGSLIPYLDRMKELGGLEDFKVVMDDTTTTPDDINHNRIVGIVSIVPARAAEDFVINFTLEPSGTTFED